MTLTEQILESLTLAEQEEFLRFMAFRAPGLRKEVGEALQVLLREGDIPKERLHAAVFGKSAYNDKAVRYLLTDINRLLYDFLTFKRVMGEEREGRLLLLRELMSRNCKSAFTRVINQEMAALDLEKDIGPEALKHRFDISFIKVQHELEQGQRSTDRFASSTTALDRYFVAQKLQMSAEHLNLHFILSTSADDPFLDLLLREVDTGRFNDTPYILLYRDVVHTLQQPDDADAFKRLRQRAGKEALRLPHHERQDLYQHMLNYCIRRVNAGKREFQHELFGIYREALDNGALLTNGAISQWDFKNIVTIGLRLKEMTAVQQFIDTYGSLLSASHRTNAIAYNTANLHFHEGHYRQALAQLQRVDLDDVFYRLDARSILLKTYFEMDDMDAVFYHASAFRSFLSRNRRISDHQRKLYQNLVRFTLSLARNSANRHRIRTLRKKVADTPNVADLTWLETKLSELEA